RRALDIRVKALGPEDPAVAGSLTDLGILYGMEGNYAEAEKSFLRALTILEKAFGLEHPRLLKVLDNLTLLYCAHGKHRKAAGIETRAKKLRASSIWRNLQNKKLC